MVPLLISQCRSCTTELRNVHIQKWIEYQIGKKMYIIWFVQGQGNCMSTFCHNIIVKLLYCTGLVFSFMFLVSPLHFDKHSQGMSSAARILWVGDWGWECLIQEQAVSALRFLVSEPIAHCPEKYSSMADKSFPSSSKNIWLKKKSLRN